MVLWEIKIHSKFQPKTGKSEFTFFLKFLFICLNLLVLILGLSLLSIKGQKCYNLIDKQSDYLNTFVNLYLKQIDLPLFKFINA